MQATKQTSPKSRRCLTDEIVEQLARRHSTAVVLLHHAVAQRLGLGPTDHKCLDLLREHETMTGSELAAITDLTTGAITGVVARLENAGYLRREEHKRDGRMQILRPVEERAKNIHAVFKPLRADIDEILKEFDAHQLAGIAKFLDRTTDVIRRHVTLLRADARLLSKSRRVGARANTFRNARKHKTRKRNHRGVSRKN